MTCSTVALAVAAPAWTAASPASQLAASMRAAAGTGPAVRVEDVHRFHPVCATAHGDPWASKRG